MKKLKDFLILLFLILVGYFLFVPKLIEQNKEEWESTGAASVFEALYPD